MSRDWIQFVWHDPKEYVSVYRIVEAKRKLYTGRILMPSGHFDPCFNFFDRPDAETLERIMFEFQVWRRLVALGLAQPDEHCSEGCPEW